MVTSADPRRRGARTVGGIAMIALAVVGIVGATATAAHADFAGQCSAPTRVISDNVASISLNPGDVALITGGNFTQGIDNFPAESVLCVAAGAGLAPGYMNNAAGSLVVANGATLTMPSVAVNAGFELQLEGAATFAGFNINGSSSIHVATTGSMIVNGWFSPSSGDIVNNGHFTITGGLNANSGVSVTNNGRLIIGDTSTLNGPLRNTGLVEFASGLTINGSGSFDNSCAVGIAGNLSNAASSSNSGIVAVTGNFTNNGGATWRQLGAGVLVATELSNDGSISGYGQYKFSGASRVQGSFVGDSVDDPIFVETVAPDGQIFDIETGTISNVVRRTVFVRDLHSHPTELCSSGEDRPSANVFVGKTGPATVAPGEPMSYTVTVTNAGPDAADDVVVTDNVPPALTNVSASNAGVVDAQTVTWSLGELAPSASVTLTVSGTAVGTSGDSFTNYVSSQSATPDPDPGNNDGSSADAQVTTELIAVTPPNVAPTPSDLTRVGTTGSVIAAKVTATDPDPDQKLTYSIVSGPTFGLLYMLGSGEFGYRSASNFTGVDSATFTVCDNGTPAACSVTPGLITLNVFPLAADDAATSFSAVPVTIPVQANDSDGALLQSTVVAGPTNGDVSVDSGTGEVTYTSATTFVGEDTFTYRICSPVEESFCDQAIVTVEVLPENLPPVIDPEALVTEVDTPVTSQLVATDPNSDTLEFNEGDPPNNGIASVTPTGLTTYTPGAGYYGKDLYTVFVCDDGEPQLCSTNVVDVTVTVVSPATPDGGADKLAATGIDPRPVIALAFALLAAGIAVVGRRRRRRVS